MALHRQVPDPFAAARIGAIKDRQMVVFKARRALHGHGAAAIKVGLFDILGTVTDGGEKVEIHRIKALGIKPKGLGAKRLAKGPFVERKLDIKGLCQSAFQRFDLVAGKAFFHQGFVVDAWGLSQRCVPHGVFDDRFDPGLVIPESFKGRRNRLVYNLEVSAAGEFLEFYQGKIRLDAGCIAIHHQTDGAGRGNH